MTKSISNPFETIDQRLINIENILSNLNEKTLKELIERPLIKENAPERLINKKEAAELLGVSLSTIDNYRRKGILQYKKIHGVVRFKYSEVLKAIDELQKA